MVRQARRFLVVLVVVGIITSTPVSIVGIAGGTQVSSGDSTSEESVYPGQTVPVANFSVQSEDELINNQDNDKLFGKSGSDFLDAEKRSSELFIDTGNQENYYDEEDVILYVNDISKTNSNLTTAPISKIPDNVKYIDEDGSQTYTPSDPVINDSGQDNVITKSDEILFSGNSAVAQFEETPETEIYLDGNVSDGDGFSSIDPVFSVDYAGKLSRGSLDSGDKLLRKGKAPIHDFDEYDGDPYYIDQITAGDLDKYDDEEAILIDANGDGEIEPGKLSIDDKIVKEGNANLRVFQENEAFYINENDPGLNRYDHTEAIIQDTGNKNGKLDSEDKIIFSGSDHVSDIGSNSASYGTGDVYIGNSTDKTFDEEEFIYVESGEQSGYSPDQDLLLSTKGDPNLTDGENKATKLYSDDFTNIGFLDLNNNGEFDTLSENSGDPGSEPLVEFGVPAQSFEDEKIGQKTNILPAADNYQSTLDIAGELKHGEELIDIVGAKGPNEEKELIYADSSGKTEGILDPQEFLIEDASDGDVLSENDYIVRSGPVTGFESEFLSNEIEYIDLDREGTYSKKDYLIRSSIPDNDIINRDDEIISTGTSTFGDELGPSYEFLDMNENGDLDKFETILKSESPGNNEIEPADRIYMSDIEPGHADLKNFDSNFDTDKYAEGYVDLGDDESDIDNNDTIVNFSIVDGSDKKYSIFDRYLFNFASDKLYIDDSNDEKYTKGEVIYQENDYYSQETTYGDRLTAVTVENDGTLPSDAIESVSIQREGTEIATTKSHSNGVWTLQPSPENATIGTNETNLTVTATVSANAPTDATLDFQVSPLDDGGFAGEFDTGDRGLFFADAQPRGGLDAGPTYSVDDPADISAEAVAFRNPGSEYDPTIEVAFTDDIDPTTTQPEDFAVESLDANEVNVTGVADDDGDGRVLLELEEDTAPTQLDGLEIADGALSVTSGAAVPGQSIPLTTTSVTVAEASERSRIVYRGERVAVLANDAGESGDNATPNFDEKIRIDRDTTGDGDVDELKSLDRTGPASLVSVLETNGSNASAYRVTFESDDGESGESVAMPVESVALSVTANRTNRTDAAGPIGARITAADGDRVVRAELREVENDTLLDERTVRLDREGEGVVRFPPRVANVTIVATDLGTGVSNRSENVTVRKGYPGAEIEQDVIERDRGGIARIGLRLVDTKTANVIIGEPRVNYQERVTVADRDGDGNIVVEWNTHRAGSGGPGKGIGVAGNDNASLPDDEVLDVDRMAPKTPFPTPLERGNYTVEASVDGEVTDVALLAIDSLSTDGATTLVAPADATLATPADVENVTTARKTVAVGDTAIVAIEAGGLDGFMNESTDLRRGSAAAARTGAYLDVRRANPPKNARAPRLNVSNASKILDGRDGELYVVVPTDGDPYSLEAGTEFDARFVVNESSPYVGPGASKGNGEPKSVETGFGLETPDGQFAELSDNGTLDLPASNTTSIAGETNVAPGTNVTITVRSDDQNETFRKSDEDTVEENGTFEGTVDLSEYDEGTEYTVVASANDEELTTVRTGSIVEEPIAVQAAQTVTAGGGTGGGSGGGGIPEPSATATQTSTTGRPTTADSPDAETTTPSVPQRAATFVTRDLPEFVRTRETTIVVGLGILAFLYGLLGLRRLTK